jgi:hypothetical protein
MYAEDYYTPSWGEWLLGFIKTKEYDFANPLPFVPPRFEADDPKLAAFFHENGFVVVKEVAKKEDRDSGVGLFWDLVEQMHPRIRRNDPSTWDEWIADPGVGIMSGFGVGQSPFMWHARTLPKVKQAFTQVWDTDDLLVSFDGCGVFRPPERNPTWRTKGAWYHIDQNCYKKPGLHAVQGLVNYFPSGPHDGGFVVVPKSSHMINAAFEKHNDICSGTSGHYVKMRPELGFWKEARASIGKRDTTNKYDLLPVKLVIEAGDMVLWDSRTIHCNHPVTKLSPDPEAANRLKRLTAYICMTPASLAQNLEELVKYRIYAFQKGVTTTHWPHEFYPSWSVKDKLPGVGASAVKLTPEQVTLITGKSLAWDAYDESLVTGVDLNNLVD